MEDYFNLVSDTMLACPREYVHCSSFPTVFSAMLAALSLKEQYSLTSVLRYCRIVVDHMNDLQHSRSSPSSQSSPSPISSSEATIVKTQFLEHGAVFMSHLLQGIIYTFPPEVQGDATGLIKALVKFCPEESSLWYAKAISGLDLTPAEMQKTASDFSM